jgi:hypothetical protein
MLFLDSLWSPALPKLLLKLLDALNKLPHRARAGGRHDSKNTVRRTFTAR